MNLRYLITGSNGQLGTEFRRILDNKSIGYKAIDINDLDICDKNRLAALCNSYKPTVIINCAAFTQVDAAEDDYEAAYATNSLAVGNLAEISADMGIYLIHFSTDYVFDGTKKGGLYTESDLPNPISKYGISKYEGEKRILISGAKSLILRSSWVFGDGSQNFVYKFLQWINSRDYLEIAFDEVSVPTYTGTIAELTLKAIGKELTGLWHLTNSGYASRYEWAKMIAKIINSDKILYPVSKDIFGLKARRPDFSAMSSNNLASELGIEIPDWEEALSCHLKKVL